MRQKEISNIKNTYGLLVKSKNTQTGIIYESISSAASETSLCKGNLFRSLKKGTKCGGYNWEYVDE